MQTTTATDNERFSIRGSVGSPVFPVWIMRHGRRLGLEVKILSQAPDRIDLSVGGPAALRDAMALGCSLGPREVWVEEIIRNNGGNNSHSIL